jgi:hypothetical protein
VSSRKWDSPLQERLLRSDQIGRLLPAIARLETSRVESSAGPDGYLTYVPTSAGEAD